MKKILNIVLTALVLTSVAALPANADILYCQGMVCSATPPAPESFATFAVVNPQGIVENVVVFSIEHAPSNMGSGYTACPNCQLVQQSPAGVTSGVMGTAENPVKYDSQAQVFTQGSVVMPVPVTRTEVVDPIVVSATINSNTVTFGPNSSVTNGQVQVTPVVDSTTAATVTAEETGVIQSQSFTTPQTRAQITVAVQEKSLLQRRLDRIFILLRGWVLD